MRILLVDPSRTALKIVSRLLEADGHEICAFTDEREALTCLAEDVKIEALLTSVQLGEAMSGMELCWQARIVAGDRRPLYIIVMSSNYERAHLIEALDSGADDFIGKPPAADELYARLRAAARLTAMQRDLIRLASTDPLTGAFNRRAFFHAASEACARPDAVRKVAAIMMDIDFFKKINDVYGHDIGDNVLKGVAAEASKVEGMVFGRLGGEEFAMILQDHNKHDAKVVAEALRALMMTLSFPSTKGEVKLTCSFGVASFQPGGDNLDAMLKRADMALYEAKSAGRNRVVMSANETAEYTRPGGVIRAGKRDGEKAAVE